MYLTVYLVRGGPQLQLRHQVVPKVPERAVPRVRVNEDLHECVQVEGPGHGAETA